MAPSVPVPFNISMFSVNSSCEIFDASLTSNGVFVKSTKNNTNNPLRHPFPFFILQIGITITMLALVRRILKPLNQPRFVAEMLTGILMSPSILGFFDKQELYASIFTANQSSIMLVLEVLCFATMSFVIGIRTDISVIKTSGKLSWTIGILNITFPLALTLTSVKFFKATDPSSSLYYEWSSILVSLLSFQVILVLLEDLRLLNSEIGRRALSSALISNVCGYIFMMYRAFLLFAMLVGYRPWDYIKTEIPRFLIVLTIIFVLRPLSFRLIKKIPEGKSISESHFLIILLTFIVVVLTCESLGYTSQFGGMVLGLAMQSGPPLGSGVVKKLEFFVNSVLLPGYIITAGSSVNVFMISSVTYQHVEGLIVLAIFGKLTAAVMPSLIYKFPFKDSITFGLILCSQGLWDVLLFENNLRRSLISQEVYSVLVVMTLINAAIITPIISYLYDPSKRYINYRRRTIQHSVNETEFRILLCVHEEDQVFSLLNILKVSNPTQQKPIGAFVLDLLELVGRNQPMFINHQLHRRPSVSESTRTERIINAFRQYELRGNEGAIKHQHFTTIAPFTTIHDDICTLTLDKNASLLIISFHKSESLAMKNITRNLLDKAPCSVGILVNKKIINHLRSNSQNAPTMSVCIIFVGGPDSREALAYAIRMVQSPEIRLTVVTLSAEDDFDSDYSEMKLDMKLLNDLRLLNEENPRIEIRQVTVRDGTETLRVLLAMDDNFDFILVGRRLRDDSTLVTGLSDWSYEEELGVLGDILASPDMKCNASVLVLQQQVTIEDILKKKQGK